MITRSQPKSPKGPLLVRAAFLFLGGRQVASPVLRFRNLCCRLAQGEPRDQLAISLADVVFKAPGQLGSLRIFDDIPL